MIKDEKKKLRLRIKDLRSKLVLEDKIKKDLEIFNHFIESELYKNASNIFIYVSMEDEIYTHKIIERAIEDGKSVSVPKVDLQHKLMKAVTIDSLKQLKEGVYGVLEPETFENVIAFKNIDLVIVPGLAFDLEGGRIGYGGGYYDKFLKDLEGTTKVALSYEFQIVDKVPREVFDITVNAIISEDKVYNI